MGHQYAFGSQRCGGRGRCRVAVAGARPGTGRDGRASRLDSAAYLVGTSRSAGDLDERDHYALRTPRRASGENGSYRGRSRSVGTENRATEGCRRWLIPSGQRWRLQPVLDGLRNPRRLDPANVPGGGPVRWEGPCKARGESEARRQPRARHRLLRVHELVGPLHHARRAGFDVSHRLQQCLSDPANSRLRRDSLRDDPRRPYHPAGRPSARRPEDPPLDGRLARTLGGRYAGRRYRQFQRQSPHQGHLQQPGLARGRALHAHRRGNDRLRSHH